jgi:hypothetical protein
MEARGRLDAEGAGQSAVGGAALQPIRRKVDAQAASLWREGPQHLPKGRSIGL